MALFEKFMKQRFGFSLPIHICIEERTNKVYAYFDALREIELRRMQRRGMLAGKLNTLYGIKPSLDFILAFGHLVRKNCITLPPRSIIQLYSNDQIRIEKSDCEDGLVIIKDENERGAALVYKRGAVLSPLIQKSRLLKKV